MDATAALPQSLGLTRECTATARINCTLYFAIYGDGSTTRRSDRRVDARSGRRRSSRASARGRRDPAVDPPIGDGAQRAGRRVALDRMRVSLRSLVVRDDAV